MALVFLGYMMPFTIRQCDQVINFLDLLGSFCYSFVVDMIDCDIENDLRG